MGSEQTVFMRNELEPLAYGKHVTGLFLIMSTKERLEDASLMIYSSVLGGTRG